MKKFTVITLVLACLLTAGCGSKEHNVTPLNELPEDYTLEQAKADGCVVHEDGDVSAGQEVWEEFVRAADAGKSASVRLCSYYTLDPERCTPEYYEAEKDNYPRMFLEDLSFDGQTYTLRWFEDGEEYVRNYEYLLRYEDEAESKTALYSSYVRYVLTHDATVTWSRICYGLVSSQFGDFIDASNVYTDLIYWQLSRRKLTNGKMDTKRRRKAEWRRKHIVRTTRKTGGLHSNVNKLRLISKYFLLQETAEEKLMKKVKKAGSFPN